MEDARNDVANLMNQNIEEDEDMTQEKFNEMMEVYLTQLAKKDSTWEKSNMEWAQAEGLITGDSNGNLMPKKFLTRGEMAAIMQRYDQKK